MLVHVCTFQAHIQWHWSRIHIHTRLPPMLQYGPAAQLYTHLRWTAKHNKISDIPTNIHHACQDALISHRIPIQQAVDRRIERHTKYKKEKNRKLRSNFPTRDQHAPHFCLTCCEIGFCVCARRTFWIDLSHAMSRHRRRSPIAQLNSDLCWRPPQRVLTRS